jgi:cholest-4-en-3-one 26-monooxygenase
MQTIRSTNVKLSDVDIYDPDNYVDGVPHEMFATLRRESPVHRHDHPAGGTFWAVTRHQDIVQVNRDAHLFSSWVGSSFINTPEGDALTQTRLFMLNMDPPEHTKLRKIVNRGFTPRRIKELQDILAERATRVVDHVIEKGQVEFVEEVASELPLQAIADFVGIPQEDRHQVFEWSNQLIGFDDPEFQEGRDETGQHQAAIEMYAYAQQLADERRKDPQDDIVTALLNAEIDGEALDDMEFNVFFLLLAVAGNETTRNAISHTMLALIEHPEQRQRLLDHPEMIDTAVEEFLRWATPVMNFRRTATADTVIGDQEIAEGDRVVMWHISGNRDETVFDDPYTFDIGRNPEHNLGHIAFGGGGPHFCLGANLARAEIKVMMEELLRRAPEAELAGPVERLRSNFINGVKRMPVRFTPA